MTTHETPRKPKSGEPGPGQQRINFFITEDAYQMMLELGKLWNPLLSKGYGVTVDRALREAYERHIAGAGASTPHTSRSRGKV